MTEIAKEFHCAISLIFYILKKHKVPRQNHRKLNFQSVANKYLSGKSMNEIAKLFNVHQASIWYALRKMNVKSRSNPYYFLGRKLSQEHIDKSSKSRRGKHHSISDENRRKMIKAHCSKKACKKISEKLKGLLVGEQNPAWRGGKSFEPYPLTWRKELRKQIRIRDNCKCQLCGVPQLECERQLHIHHIDYNKENLNLSNLISLCNSCHCKTNFNRDYWSQYFKNMIGGKSCQFLGIS